MSVGDRLRRRWPKDWPVSVIPRVSWAQQRPTYRDARPAIINAALDRAQARPTGNWYVFAASGAFVDASTSDWLAASAPFRPLAW